MSNLTSEILSNLNEKQHNSYVFRCKEVQVHSEKVYIQWITHIPNKWASRNVLRKNKYNFNNACISQNSTVRHQTFICSVRTECVGANIRHQGWNKSEDLITEESKRKLIAMAGRLVFQSNQWLRGKKRHLNNYWSLKFKKKIHKEHWSSWNSPKQNIHKKHWSSGNSLQTVHGAGLQADGTTVYNRVAQGTNPEVDSTGVQEERVQGADCMKSRYLPWPIQRLTSWSTLQQKKSVEKLQGARRSRNNMEKKTRGQDQVSMDGG